MLPLDPAGPPAPAARPVPALADREFRRFQELVLSESGIHLTEVKRALLVGRLSRRLRALALDSWADYFQLVSRDLDERTQMIDAVSTNETHFFREPRQWEFLQAEVFPRWRAEAAAGARGRAVRAWSAACSTGEEPYTLAMSFLEAFPEASGWSLEVTATDISTRVLARAREAAYPLQRASEIPAELLRRYMLRGVGSQEGRMRAGPALRERVRFERANLLGQPFPVRGPFDLVFCRNVLIYFRPEDKRRVVDRILPLLAPGGLLLLGHAESLSGLHEGLRAVGPMSYAVRSRR